MDSQKQLESHHGVLMNIAGSGVLIIGLPAIGKSSLALELLSKNYQLIADDVVDFSYSNNTVIGHCPDMLMGMLHTRELGFISVSSLFGDKAWKDQWPVNYVIKLTDQFDSNHNPLVAAQTYTILNHAFPLLTLSVTNPASVSTRILCWLNMQVNQNLAENELKRRQSSLMSIAK